MRELTVEILKAAGREPGLVDVPDPVTSLISRFGFLPGAPLTRDQWLMLQHDNVAEGPGLDAFGIRPTPFGAVAPEWLGMFGGNRFARRRVNLTATSVTGADPPPRHHPRHRRGGHRISARLVDRPSDPRHRAAGLQGRRMGGVQHRHPAGRDPGDRRSLLADVLATFSPACSSEARAPGRFVRNILLAFVPAVVLGLAFGDYDRADARKRGDRRLGPDHRRRRDPGRREAVRSPPTAAASPTSPSGIRSGSASSSAWR